MEDIIVRRKDREVDLDQAYEIIDKSDFGVMSMSGQKGIPYGVPLSFARKGRILYFHAALDGRKAELIRENPSVSITFVSKNKVPELFSNQELDEVVKKDKNVGHLLGSKVFTTEFESAVISGKAVLLGEDEDRIAGLRIICEKYTPDKMKYFQYAVDASLKVTAVYKIEIEEISGKMKNI